MNNFKILYKILKFLEQALDYEEFPHELFNAEAFGLSEPRYASLIESLVKDGYIEGISVINTMGGGLPGIKLIRPKITIAGLEFLEENSLMKKITQTAKGIVDVIK